MKELRQWLFWSFIMGIHSFSSGTQKGAPCKRDTVSQG